MYAIPDDQITCPPVLVGFGLLQGLVTTLLIRQVTETLTERQATLFIVPRANRLTTGSPSQGLTGQ